MAGGERRLLLGGGETDLAFSAFALENSGRLDDFRAHVLVQGLNLAPSPTPLFAEGAFMVHDPDGRGVVFGVPAEPADVLRGGHDRLAGRLRQERHAEQAGKQREREQPRGPPAGLSQRLQHSGARSCGLSAGPGRGDLGERMV